MVGGAFATVTTAKAEQYKGKGPGVSGAFFLSHKQDFLKEFFEF